MGSKPVLIVDDEEGIRSMLKTALEMYDYQVYTAGNGQEAIDILTNKETPGLILLDLMMPVMNGWALAEALTQNPHWVDIPVVIISAFPDRAGTFPTAKATIFKPLDFDFLLAEVEKYCGKS